MTGKLRASSFKILTDEEWKRFQKVMSEQEKQQQDIIKKERGMFRHFPKW
jgi:hypothetical protein